MYEFSSGTKTKINSFKHPFPNGKGYPQTTNHRRFFMNFKKLAVQAVIACSVISAEALLTWVLNRNKGSV
jgi:hypothetical protein